MSGHALAVRPTAAATVWTDEQKDLVKRTVCKGATDDELAMFMYVATKTGLDPFLRQIHSVPRREKGDDGKWTIGRSIQVGIDGLRLVADRSGRYAPGREPEFVYNTAGKLEKATAFVRKLTNDGTWHDVAASAHFDEYVQMRAVWEGEKKVGQEPNRMWAEKEHVMLAKCAEALALRRGFPAETSGLYIHEEMIELDAGAGRKGRDTIETPRAIEVGDAPTAEPASGPGYITEPQRRMLFAVAHKNGRDHTDLKEHLAMLGIDSTAKIPAAQFDGVLAWAEQAAAVAIEEPGAAG